MSIFFQKKPKNFNSTVEVSTVFIEAEQKILFLQRSKTKISPGLWAVPGGKLEKGETPLDALKREIWEELQIVAKPEKLEFLHTFYIKNVLMNYTLHSFYWKASTIFDVKININEHQSYIWQPINKTQELPLIEGQHKAFIRALRQKKLI